MTSTTNADRRPDSPRLARSELLLGDAALQRLGAARIIIFGCGGVGSWAAEALVRTGAMHVTLVDFDTVAPSNVNRQAQATALTVGLPKAETLRALLAQINPDADITAIDGLYSPDTQTDFDLAAYDYVIDAIDSLRDKALLILNATSTRTCRLFSSMGAALKTDPTRVRTAEFRQAKGCRLAAALRNRFKRTGEMPRRKFRVVYSDEIFENRGHSDEEPQADAPIRKSAPNGSLMQVTATFGMTLASMVVDDILRLTDGK